MPKRATAREKLLDVTFEEVYIHGYAATSVDTILKKAGVPKGSMYHHFKSKKELVLAMVEERLFPKMETFFDFKKEKDQTVVQSIRNTLAVISKNKPLVTYGCPLYRLMVELSPVDKEFDILLSSKVKQMQEALAVLLRIGIDEGELNESLDVTYFSAYIFSAVWGILSLSPTLSSSKNFIAQSKYIVKQLEQYKN